MTPSASLVSVLFARLVQASPRPGLLMGRGSKIKKSYKGLSDLERRKKFDDWNKFEEPAATEYLPPNAKYVPRNGSGRIINVGLPGLGKRQ